MTTTKKPVHERDIEKYLVSQIKVKGSEVRKVKWIGRRNAPDRVFGSKRFGSVFVEVKAPGKSLTPAQVREFERMTKSGFTVAWVNSFADVDLLIRVYFQGG